MSEDSTPPLDFDNRRFWIDQIIAGVISAAGIDLRHDFPRLGLIIFGFGVIWLVFLRWEGKSMTSRIRTPNALAIIILCIATSVIGYDILERYLADHNDDAFASRKWSAYHDQVRLVIGTLEKQGCSQYNTLDANNELNSATTTNADVQADLKRKTGTPAPSDLLADALILEANDRTLKSVRLNLQNIEQKCLATIDARKTGYKDDAP